MRTSRWAIAALVALLVSCGTPGVAWAQDAGGTNRMFFAPTGHTLPKGEGYVGVYSVFLPFVQVGVTDAVTVGAATPIVPYLMMRSMGGPTGLPFAASAKARLLHRPNTDVAAGVIHFSAGGRSHGGFAYVVGTRDTATGSTSIGAGCAYAITRSGSGCSLVLTAGGSHRVSPRVSLISENHLVVGQTALVTGGVRLTRGRLSTDYGLGLAVGSGLLPGVIINMAYRFGGQ